jgi:hypothetical protein
MDDGRDLSGDVVRLRAGRTRYVIGVIFTAPFALAGLRMILLRAISGDAWTPNIFARLLMWIALEGLLLWLLYVVITKAIWPPDLEVSATGLRYSLQGKVRSYRWDELYGPDYMGGASGVPLLKLVVKSTGRLVLIPPTHFGMSYDRLAQIITRARTSA